MNPNKFTIEELRYLESIVGSEYVKDKIVLSAYSKICKLIDDAQDWIDAQNVEFKWASAKEYTLNTLEKAPYGTIITFTYNAASNIRVQCYTPPTTLLKMFKRDSYHNTSSACEPVVMAIKLNLKTWELLNNKIIPNELFPFYGNMANINTLTEVAYLDYGYCNSNQG